MLRDAPFCGFRSSERVGAIYLIAFFRTVSSISLPSVSSTHVS